MLFPRKSITDGAWKPGLLAEESCCPPTTYFIGGNAADCDYSLIRFKKVGDIPAAGSKDFCGGQCEDEGGDICITVKYPNCCVDGVTINIPYPCEGEDLGEHILCHIRGEGRVAGLGAFGWDAANSTLNFRSRFPGFPVDFEVKADSSVFDVCVQSAPENACAGKRDRIVSGTAVVSSPMRNQGEELQAFVPTQDVNTADATECWLGVAVCTENAGELPPTMPGFPFGTSCDSPCAPEPTCVQVIDSGTVYIELEKAWDKSMGCTLYYRYAPDMAGGYTEAGFSPVAGPGLAEVPVRTLIKGSRNGGSLVKVKFG